MIPPQLPQSPAADLEALVRWINETRRVLDAWMRRVERNKQVRLIGPYTITAGDVAAGVIKIETGLTDASTYSFRLRTGAANNAELAWTGAVTVAGGTLTFTNAGATPFVAGNLLHVWVQGEG